MRLPLAVHKPPSTPHCCQVPAHGVSLLFVIGLSLWFCLCMSLAWSAPVWAAVPNQAEPSAPDPLRIRNVDVSGYPQITVTVELAGAAVAAPDTLEVQENQRTQPSTRYAHTGDPLDLAVLLDLSTAGQDNIPAIAELVKGLTANLPANTRYALFAPTADGRTAQAVPLGVSYGASPFYSDRNAFNDTLLRFSPSAPDNTALIEQVAAIQQQFPADSTNPHILVFTGPVATSGTGELDGLQPACSAGLHVHTVLVFAAEGTAANSSLLDQLTAACNGVNTDMATASQGQAPFQAAFVPAVYDLVYRSRSRHPDPISVFVQAPGGGRFSAVKLGTTVPASSLAVTITAPVAGSKLGTTSAIQVTAVANAIPPGVRVLTATYSLNGGAPTLIANPGRDLSFILPPQHACGCLLELEVIDELGNSARATIPFQVSTGRGAETEVGAGLVADPALTPGVPSTTPDVTPTPTTGERIGQWWAEQSRSLTLRVAALGTLTMLVIILTAFVARQSRSKSEPTGNPGPTVKDDKIPLTRPANAPAMLQAEGELPGAPRQIKLDREQIVIGRNRAVVDEVIADDRVSNRHCTVRRENTRYTVEDHGATNGTWINDKPVTDTPFELKPGDILKIGPAHYRFVVGAHARSSTPPLRSEHGLPYVPTRKLSNQPALPKEGEQ